MNLPHRAQYLALQSHLERLQESCRGSFQASGESNAASALYSDLQSQFQALLAALPPQERQQLQRYNTEIFKELQLLGPDLMRFPLLKPGAKQEQLLERVTQRCDRLRGYISTLLESSA